jgi:hypothetical protein
VAARRNLQLLVLALLVVAAMLAPSVGRATGGRYAFAGGTPRQQAEVVRAPTARAELLRRLGGTVWCAQIDARRDQLCCERFASALPWAFWPSADNCMRPAGTQPAWTARFRKLVSGLIDTDTRRAGGDR